MTKNLLFWKSGKATCSCCLWNVSHLIPMHCHCFLNAVFPEMYQKWLISQDIDHFFPRDTWLTKMFIGYACLCSIDRWQPRVAAALSCRDVNKHGKRRMSGQYSAGRRVFPRPCFFLCPAPRPITAFVHTHGYNSVYEKYRETLAQSTQSIQ